MAWTGWLENPGTGDFPGDSPVPEWAEDFEVRTKNGHTHNGSENDVWLWKLDLPGRGITHYRYKIPDELANLAKIYREGSGCNVPVLREYTNNDLYRVRRDLGLIESTQEDNKMNDEEEYVKVIMCGHAYYIRKCVFLTHGPFESTLSLTQVADAVFDLRNQEIVKYRSGAKTFESVLDSQHGIRRG